MTMGIPKNILGYILVDIIELQIFLIPKLVHFVFFKKNGEEITLNFFHTIKFANISILIIEQELLNG